MYIAAWFLLVPWTDFCASSNPGSGDKGSCAYCPLKFNEIATKNTLLGFCCLRCCVRRSSTNHSYGEYMLIQPTRSVLA